MTDQLVDRVTVAAATVASSNPWPLPHLKNVLFNWLFKLGHNLAACPYFL